MQRILQLSLIFNLLVLSILNGQTVWPGDINENGQVNAVDLLYFGVAKGTSGPQRDTITTLWKSHSVNQLWSNNFATNINYAKADCNGNGIVDSLDYELGLESNNGLVHTVTNPIDEGYLEGVEGTDPPIILTPSTTMAYEGDTIEISLDLGTPSLPVNDFYGLAVYVSYSSNLVEDNTPIVFNTDANSWIDPSGTNTRAIINNDDAAGIASFGITRTNQTNIPTGSGIVGKFVVGVEDIVITPYEMDTLIFTIDSVLVIDKNLVARAIALPASASTSVIIAKGNRSPVTCPKVVDPVVATNGNTYLNSCFAEHDGQFEYVSGTGFGDCIDVNNIDLSALADCDEVYEPVCGCNNVTYQNECQAKTSGVESYVPGQCPTSTDCFDKEYILSSGHTKYDEDTGFMATNCGDEDEPVCGCNEITYKNACIAEASGVVFYTSGTCSSDCVDATQMNPGAINNTAFDPVCGCNGVTYSNSAAAQSAGVQSFTSGACGANAGASSAWCNEAVPIQCGDFFAYETTSGAGNDIESYPSCSSSWFQGNDKVYVISKTTAGDLQIGLEILTPNVDLDLFLLAGDCSAVTCIKSSTTDNKYSNNEGIVYEDAPIGTYYIVVDAQYANVVGDFRIEVNCGYMDCNGAVSLTCGTTYNGTTVNGQNNVSLYSCINVQNVENNGPEIVHTFTTTETGNVNIELNMWNTNLELFLLNACDRGGCIEYSSNPGSTTETISTYLPAGTYYVVVDGYNGASGEYSLKVDCTSSCDLNINCTSTQSNCGQNTGKILVSSIGGTPSFIVSWTGPVSNSIATSSNQTTITGLPSGIYTVTKTDVNGCSASKVIEVQDGSNFSFVATPVNAVCSTKGSIKVVTNGGVIPFKAYLTGQLTGSTNWIYKPNFTIIDLPAGTYTLKIVDRNGCSSTQSVTIGQDNNNFNFTATPTAAACGQLGKILIQTSNGVPNYTVSITGPVNKTGYATSSAFWIQNLPAGTYQVTVEDGNWCSETKTVVIGSSDLSFSVTPHNGLCSQKGSIDIAINNGTPDYHIAWTSTNGSGSVEVSTNTYSIQNLSSGTYTITIEDANGCSHYKVVTITNGNSTLSTTATPIQGSCGYGSIWVDLNSGVAPYTISWTGAAINSATTSNNGYDITNLPVGSYWISITDANGCSSTHDVVLTGSSSSMYINTSNFNGSCGSSGKIVVHIHDGNGPYTVSWDGPSSDSDMTTGINYPITNLASGTYGITVTDSNGCEATTTATLNNSTSTTLFNATPIIGTCGENGKIKLTFVDGQSPYSISWTGPSSSNGQSSTSIFYMNNLESGVYQILVVDDAGCAQTKSITLTNHVSVVDFTLATVPGNCGSTGKILVDITSGTADYTVSWTGPTAATSGSISTSENWYNIHSLISGIYEVTVTDDTGCSHTKTITLNNTASDITIVTGAAPGACGNGGTIWVDVKTGEPDFTLEWIGPGSTTGSITQTSPWFDINDLPSGVYTLKVIDNTGCYIIEQITLNNSDEQLSVVATPTHGTCGAMGSIWLEITGGTTPFTIEWSGPETGSTTTNNYSHDISNLTSGNYSITVTDANGCSTTQLLSVYNTNIFNISTTTNNGNCSGNGSILVEMNLGTPNYSIVWTCTSCGDNDNNGATVVDDESYLIQNLAQGTYNVVVTDGSGCSATSTKMVASTNSDLSISTMVTNAKCNALGSIWIDISGGSEDYTITWGVGTSKTISTNSWDINNLESGTYTIVVVDANGCSVTKTVIVGSDNNNLDFTTNATHISCGTPGSIEINISNGTPYYTISWDGPQTNSITTNDPTYILSDLVSGTYTITVVDAAGCSKYRLVEINNEGGGLNVDFTLTPSNCGVVGSIWLDFSNGQSPYTISWSGTAAGNDSTNDEFYDITGLYIGNYTVTVTDANGCNIIQSVELLGSEALNVTVTSTNGSCQNSDGAIYISMNNGNPNYTITWAGPQSNSATVSGNSFSLNSLPAGTYQLTITDALGCAFNTSQVIDNSSGAPVANFDSSSDSYTATFTNTGSTGNYSWTFGDGTASTDVNPTHEYQQGGTYNVCLTVTNSCGSNTTCKDVVISVSGSYVILDIENGTGASGNIVEIPVTAQNIALLVSLAGSLEVENSDVAEIVGLTNGVIAPQFFSVNNTFNYYANNGQGISISNNDVLFYINVKLIGDAGTSTVVRFVDSPLPVEVGSMVNGVVTAIPHITSSGIVNIPVATSISGKVSTYWGEGIDGVEINLSGQGFLMNETTNAAGLFNLPNIPTGNMVEISADKDINDANGLSTFALFAGQRFILGLDPIEITSPYQVIAGDADCNGSFSTIDLFVIQQLIIGTNDAFSSCPSWVFVSEHNEMPDEFDAYNVFPYSDLETMMAGDQTQVNFVGVKVGDILGQANPDGLKSEDDDRYSENIQINIFDQSVEKGEEFEVEFTSSNFEKLVSLQGNLAFDSDKIDLVDSEKTSFAALKSLALGTNDAQSGNIRMSWFSLSGRGVSFDENNYLFKLKFIANEDLSSLKDIFEFTNDGINTIVYDIESENLGMVINVLEETTASSDIQKGYALFQNIPNPFLDYTIIQFELPNRMDATITIKNNIGQIIKKVKGTFDKGVQSIRIDKSDLGTGVFYYSLETVDYFGTKKMIAVN